MPKGIWGGRLWVSAVTWSNWWKGCPVPGTGDGSLESVLNGQADLNVLEEAGRQLKDVILTQPGSAFGAS